MTDIINNKSPSIETEDVVEIPSIDVIVENFTFELKPFEGVYQAYYPPPQALLKAVTPITKTIVLLS